MSNNSAFFVRADASTDRVPNQGLDPYNGFGCVSLWNRRTVGTEIIGEAGFTHRGAKNIVWSSEGWTPASGTAVVAVTAAQKRATGNHNTNLGGTAALDTSAFRALLIMVSLTGISGGSSPSIQFGLNFQDDTASPVSFSVWAPTALTAPGSSLIGVGGGMSNTGSVAIPVGPQSQFTWTVSGGPTTCTWTAWVYGIN